jgi:N-acetylglucosaminyldiphosphoundecaprenol N-acetyl-beta-D-mannosaminyltransferase
VTPPYQQILGVKFFNGDVEEAIDFMSRQGGFLVAPSGTCFSRLRHDNAYRKAVTQADVAIADSGAMVLLWRILRGRKITRISGWKYLQRLVARLFAEKPSRVLWVLPTERAREKTGSWLRSNNFAFIADFYVAPRYGGLVEDRQLLAQIEHHKPAHIVIGIGGGPQEKLGHFLRQRLSYRPAIHCIGGALGFLTGDQKPIPDWADRFYLGWFLRLLAQPRHFIPRLWNAHELPWLIWKYGENLPPLCTEKVER